MCLLDSLYCFGGIYPKTQKLIADSNIWGCGNLMIYAKLDTNSVLVVKYEYNKIINNTTSYKKITGKKIKAFIDHYDSSDFFVKDYCSDASIDVFGENYSRYYLAKGRVIIKKVHSQKGIIYKICLRQCIFRSENSNIYISEYDNYIKLDAVKQNEYIDK